MSASATRLLGARRLEVGFSGRAILPPFDFCLERGEVWAILGRNGSGKSTVVRSLLGLCRPVAGAVETESRTAFAYVPQRFALDPLVPSRVKYLIAEGVEERWSFLRPWHSSEAKQRIADAIVATAVGPLTNRRYADLSEGQKQRVLLARALAGRPDVLVLDEPTSAMDGLAESQTIDILRSLKQARGMGILLVTHHLGAVSGIVDRVLFLDADGWRVRAGTPAEMAIDESFLRHHGSGLHGDHGREAALSEWRP